MSKTIVFTDIDDTLIQTKQKIQTGKGYSDAAWGRDGQILSYVTESQQRLIEMLSAGGAHVIPVTGRNKDALDRINLNMPPSRYKIVSHGAMILDEEWNQLSTWLDHISELSEHWTKRLELINDIALSVISKNNLDARSRVIYEGSVGAYASIKGTYEALSGIRTHLTDYLALDDVIENSNSQFTVHINGRNMAYLPPYASKREAVEFTLRELDYQPNDLVIGAGDSLSDLPFLQKCDFMLIPAHSQINAEALHDKFSH